MEKSVAKTAMFANGQKRTKLCPCVVGMPKSKENKTQPRGQYRRWDKKAMNSVLANGMSVREASRKHDIPRGIIALLTCSHFQFRHCE